MKAVWMQPPISFVMRLRYIKCKEINNIFDSFCQEAYKYTFSRTTDWQGPINYFRNLPLADPSIIKEEGPGKCIPVDTLFLIGNNDPEINLELVSQSAEYVDR